MLDMCWAFVPEVLGITCNLISPYTGKIAGYHSRPAVMAVLADIAGIASHCGRLSRIALKVVATMTKEGPTWPISSGHSTEYLK